MSGELMSVRAGSSGGIGWNVGQNSGMGPHQTDLQSRSYFPGSQRWLKPAKLAGRGA